MKKLLFFLFLTGCSQPGRIIDRPIIFDQERINLTLQYMKERYGLDQNEPVIEPQMIVVHYTVIPTLEKTFEAFVNATLPSSRDGIATAGSLNVSSQFVIDQDGTIYRLMPEIYMARHVIGLNHCAIGIENVGGTEEVPLTEAQLNANIWLVRYLKKKYDIQYLIGHQEYTRFEGHELWLEKDDNYRTEKSDPGIQFMEDIRRETAGLGFLPIPDYETGGIDKILFDSFEEFKEPSLSVQRIKHRDLLPLIKEIGNKNGFEVHKVGESIKGRSLSLISIGTGETDIFLWSQMHGNEPTATMAIFDIINFLDDNTFLVQEKEELLRSTRIHFLPMLNPDGAERFTRRNELQIDINRDALRLQSPEGRTLKRVRDSLDAAFGFNLHDQSRYYNADRTSKPATISYLAPAYNYEKNINEVRANAMKVIGYMNRIIQKYAPGQVGRYNDDFEPRAFGDNIQKWGTSAILIESGGHYNDPEKQFIRKLNYMSILSAIFTIADGSYKSISLDEYSKIPENDRKLFDLKIENLIYELEGEEYIVDLGIIRNHIDNESADSYHFVGTINEVGDLSTYYGYESIDANGLKFASGRLYAGLDKNYKQLADLDFLSIMHQGYTEILLKEIPDQIAYSEYPVNLTTQPEPRDSGIVLGMNASFTLKDGDQIKYVIINGFLQDLKSNEIKIKNGIIR